MSDAMRELGHQIYDDALSDRRGFRQDQTGIDDDIWPEIYEAIGQAALEHAGEHAGRGVAEYSQGVAGDGAAILKDGQPMTIEEILSELRQPPAPLVPDEMPESPLENRGDLFAQGFNHCRELMISPAPNPPSDSDR